MSTASHSAGPEAETERERRVTDALATLDLEGKVALLSGASAWALPPNPDIGLGRLVMSDGPVGVRGESWGPADPSVQLPSPTALAATWDPDLVRATGTLLAQEARRKGVHVLLAPTVNMHRSPLGGRHFETFSEDPYLTGELGVAYVRGVQDGGVAATVKHFVANDSETERFTVDVRVSGRALREIYMAPFETIVTRAHPWGVMSAYNRVNGVSMTEHADLNTVLRSDWGFDGVLVSDWTAARDTVRDCLAGLDIAMPGPTTVYGRHLLEAVRDGRVSEKAVDTLARRVLRLAARVGALDGAPPAVPTSQLPAPLEGRALARDVARRSFVLLRNENSTLPLDSTRLDSVALVGMAAAEARTSGGGSATVFAEHTVSPLEGLRAALPGHVRLTHSAGVDPRVQLPALATPLTATFRAADGGILATEELPDGTAQWIGEFPADLDPDDLAGVEVAGTFTPETTGRHTFAVVGIGHFTLTVDGREVHDGTLTFSGDDPAAALFDPPTATAGVELTAGRPVSVRLVHDGGTATGEFPMVAFRLAHSEPLAPDETLIGEAVDAAAGSDVAVVVVNTTAEVESEGFDRSSLALPGRQDELVSRVAAANPNTVVVVNTGSPVEMPWRDEVPAVLLTWFGGQEVGGALADVLLGTHDPSGRLPTTWPARESDVPVREVVPTDGALVYDEDVYVGYRAWDRVATTPAFPFGHGLSYTTWRYDILEVLPASGTAPEGELARLRVTLTNIGDRDGREVVQVYLAPHEPGDRPTRVLAGFASVGAGAGDSRTVEIAVARRAAEIWASDAGRWELVPGDYTVSVGRSIADPRLWGELHVG
ncbi:glycoside hydrolase family 3 protein [Halostreptopolyspora alba]|uniref:Glycosyl hydrolase n=1 Tax=Halostreptopolyspora alba TaxID=2487137 RepID=A0A3N0E8H0_9ACTN|nr:glycosyl hydrolase [Nocardiopsaceae bacterium YIM 96095]